MNTEKKYLLTGWAFAQLVKEQELREEEEKTSSRKEARQALVVKRLSKGVVRPTLGVTKY